MIAAYATARQRAADRTTWRLRRLDVRARRRCQHGKTLGPALMVSWAAAREELRARGHRPPETDERLRWWQR